MCTLQHSALCRGINNSLWETWPSLLIFGVGWGGGGEAEGLVRLSGALNKTVRSEKSIYHKHVDSSLLLYCTICMCTSQDYYFFGMDLQKAGMT